jgi:cobalt-zinc-cadmium resistance protein CzcA
MIENSVRRLGENPSTRTRLDIVRDASIEVRKPTMFGELIIMIVYLPILTLEGIEGKLFRPMALTVVFALAGSLIISLTLMPALAAALLRPGGSHKDNWLVRGAQRLYRPIVHWAVRQPRTVVALCAIMLGIGGFLARLAQSSSPACPKRDRHQPERLAGVSLDESIRYDTQLEKLIREQFPAEVEHIWTRKGTAEVATDPMGIELSDMFITLTPRSEWTRAQSQDELVTQIRAVLEGMPGMRRSSANPSNA